MKLSVVIPGNNEEGNIKKCAKSVSKALKNENYELILVNDCSIDNTGKIINELARNNKRIKAVHRKGERGFGKAVKAGYRKATGDYIALVMADSSDDPKDLVKMLRKAKQGYDVITGNRFTKKSKVTGYPTTKLLANRAFNNLLAFMFKMPYKDISNAFKMYKKEVIKKEEFESQGFDITIEVPLKAWIKGYKFTEIPNNWYGRKKGKPKFGGIIKGGIKYLKRLWKLYKLYLKKTQK